MTARARHAQLGDLFEQAIALAREQRAAFVDEACRGDDELRDELTSLVASHEAEPDYLDALRDQVLASSAEPVLAPGDRLGKFVIVEPIGGGGMGVVYKARDSVLGRLVALKLLPASSSADPAARERLVREAQAASALDHPNIGVIYEIGAVDSADDAGRLHIAMAYYAGDTLAQLIARGPVAIDRAIDHAAQLCAGLARAHESGIVHRDIKPANVILSDRGEIKILDFGVAKVLGSDPPRGDAWLGTLAYMSPEQTRGEDVDHRTDIWSFGVTLYELLAGVRPFRGEWQADVVRAIRDEAPVPLRAVRPDVPAALADLVERCLAKRAGDRPASCHDVLAELRGLAATRTPAVAVEREGIVVVPFDLIGPDRSDAYFVDGLTEEVITDLSRIHALRVIAWTSSMRLKGSDRDAAAVARELGVRYVLAGTVRKAADAVRVTARLFDARRDAVVWTDKLDGASADVFAIQEQVARRVVEALRIELSPAEERALAQRPLSDPRAYESYLRARYEAWRFTPEGLDRARRYIEAALEIVGPNELLYSTLGHITVMGFEAGIDPGPDALERAAHLAERVFMLDPDAPRGHWLRAFVAFQRGDVARALRAGERAIALAPGDADMLLLVGYVHARAGNHARAGTLFARALEVDPLTPLTQCMPGFLAILEGRFTEALAGYRRFYEMDPDSPFAAVIYGWVLGYAGDAPAAIVILHAAADRFESTAFGSWARSLAHGLAGEREQALAAITPAFEGAARGSEMFARALAQCLALAGATERALDALELAIALGLLDEAFLAEHDRFLASVRAVPRFAALLDRVRTTAAAVRAAQHAH